MADNLQELVNTVGELKSFVTDDLKPTLEAVLAKISSTPGLEAEVANLRDTLGTLRNLDTALDNAMAPADIPNPEPLPPEEPVV